MNQADLDRLKSGWPKFLGILILISGILCIFSGVFFLVGIPLIIAAVFLFKAASAADRYNKDGDHGAAVESAHNFIRMTAVFSIMSIITFIVYFVLILIMGLLIYQAADGADIGTYLQELLESSDLDGFF